MKPLLIKYTVLFSKAGLIDAAHTCANATRYYMPCDNIEVFNTVLIALIDSHAPQWLLSNFAYHAGQQMEAMQSLQDRAI